MFSYRHVPVCTVYLYVKVPFTTSDLMTWKESAGSYWDNPDKMYQSFKTIIENHNPDWQDIKS